MTATRPGFWGRCAISTRHRDFPGRVIGIFQPAEELAKGALAVVASGVLEKYDVAEIYGAHTEPMLPKGVFGFRVGPLQASGDLFWIRIKGKSTHGGRPHLGVDPLPAAASLVDALQTIVSPARQPHRFGRGERVFVQRRTLRDAQRRARRGAPERDRCAPLAPQTRRMIEENIRTMTETSPARHGCTAEIDWQSAVSAVINDEAATQAAIAVAQKLFGTEAVNPDMTPFMSSEDFSVYQEKFLYVYLLHAARGRAR